MTTQEIQIKAENIKAKGSPLTIEKIISIIEKEEAKKAKLAKKSAKKFEERDNAEIIMQSNKRLWGAGCKYSTQSEYQRSKLGSKFN